MKKYILKKLILSIYFIVMSVAFVLITFPAMKLRAIPTYFVIDLFYIFTIASLGFLLPVGYMVALHLATIISEGLILAASASLFLSRGDYFSWDLLWQIFQLKAVAGAIKLPILQIIIFCVSILTYIVLVLFIKKPKISLKKFYNKALVFVLSGIILLSSFGNLITHVFIKYNYDDEFYFCSDSFAYDSFLSTHTSLQKFGYYGYYFESLCRLFIPSLTPTLKNLGSSYTYDKYTSILNGLCEDNNVIMLCAESIDNYAISKELTPVLYALKKGVNLSNSGISNYYNISKEDEKTILSRKDFDYNAEQIAYSYNGNDIFLNSTFDQVGLELTKHFAREMTQRSELEGLMGITQGPEYSYSYSLPSMLNEDYVTNYIHTHWGDYYERNYSMKKNIGFENLYFYDDMKDFAISTEDLLNCFTLDSEIIRQYVDNPSTNTCFPTDKKFFTHFMTITTHGFFTDADILNKNYALLDAIVNSPICGETLEIYKSLEPTLKNSMKNYFARVIDTEYTLAYIVNYLYENDILDNTIICFSSDHIPYTNDIETFKKIYLEKVLQINSENYAHLAEGFIYSTQITNEYLEECGENRKINHLTAPNDLAPTILTLLGKNFNQELYLGTAVINKSISNPNISAYNPVYRSYYYGGIESETLLSYDGQEIVAKNPNYTPSKEEIEKFRKEYNNIFARFYHVVGKRKGLI